MPVLVPDPPSPPGRFPFGFDLTVNRYGPNDRYGNRPAPTTHTIPGCIGAPVGSTERVGDQVLTIDQDTIYADFDADVKPTDELVVPDGQSLEAGTYQVDGRVQRHQNPWTGNKLGAVIRVTRGSGN